MEGTDELQAQQQLLDDVTENQNQGSATQGAPIKASNDSSESAQTDVTEATTVGEGDETPEIAPSSEGEDSTAVEKGQLLSKGEGEDEASLASTDGSSQKEAPSVRSVEESAPINPSSDTVAPSIEIYSEKEPSPAELNSSFSSASTEHCCGKEPSPTEPHSEKDPSPSETICSGSSTIKDDSLASMLPSDKETSPIEQFSEKNVTSAKDDSSASTEPPSEKEPSPAETSSSGFSTMKDDSSASTKPSSEKEPSPTEAIFASSSMVKEDSSASTEPPSEKEPSPAESSSSGSSTVKDDSSAGTPTYSDKEMSLTEQLSEKSDTSATEDSSEITAPARSCEDNALPTERLSSLAEKASSEYSKQSSEKETSSAQNGSSGSSTTHNTSGATKPFAEEVSSVVEAGGESGALSSEEKQVLLREAGRGSVKQSCNMDALPTAEDMEPTSEKKETSQSKESSSADISSSAIAHLPGAKDAHLTDAEESTRKLGSQSNLQTEVVEADSTGANAALANEEKNTGLTDAGQNASSIDGTHSKVDQNAKIISGLDDVCASTGEQPVSNKTPSNADATSSAQSADETTMSGEYSLREVDASDDNVETSPPVGDAASSHTGPAIVRPVWAWRVMRYGVGVFFHDDGSERDQPSMFNFCESLLFVFGVLVSLCIAAVAISYLLHNLLKTFGL